MSDEVTQPDVETEVAAPAEQPAVETPTEDAAPNALLTKEDVKQAMRAERERARADKKATPTIDREGKKHDAVSGEYIEKAGEEGVLSEAAKAAAEGETGDGTVADATGGEAATDKAAETNEEVVADATAEDTEQADKPAEEAPAEETQQADQPTEADAAATRPEEFRVDVPEGHALRQQGLKVFDAADRVQADGIRALLSGTYVRVREKAELEQRLREEQEKNARFESYQVAEEQWKSSPEYQKAVDTYHQIKESVGDEGASEYWAGVESKFHGLAEAENQKRLKGFEVERAKRSAEEWREQAWINAGRMPQEVRELADFGRWFTEAVDMFNAKMVMGHYQNLSSEAEMHAKFTEMFQAQVLSMEPVKAIRQKLEADSNRRTAEATANKAQADRASAKAAETAVQEFKQGVADKREASPINPIANLDHAPDVRAAATDVTEDEQAKMDRMTEHELRNHLRVKSRDIGRALQAR